MRPESTTVAFRADISAMLEEYAVEAAIGRFIGRQAAPIFGSPKMTGGYPVMNRENFKKPASTDRSARGAYNRIVGQFGRATFDCVEHGLEDVVDDRDAELYSDFFDSEVAAGEILEYQILMAHERRVAALYSGGGWTNHNVNTAWSTTASYPVSDILTGIDALQDKCGAVGADISLIIPRTDLREMMETTQITNKIQYTYPGAIPAELTPKQLAGMLGIRSVLVGSCVYDSTEEGVAETNTQIWTAGVCYLAVLANEGASLKTPSAARTILWTGSAPVLPVVESYRSDEVRGEVVRVRDDTDEVLQGETDLFVYKLTNT